jgi:F0F1-type ATP synthase assembly protein I
MKTLTAVLTIMTGIALMVVEMVAGSEPGSIPLLMIGFGAGWLFITRVQVRPRRKLKRREMNEAA